MLHGRCRCRCWVVVGEHREHREHRLALRRTTAKAIRRPAANAAVEFINMMATIDRLPAAARVLDYLGAAGDFGALAARTLVADADRIAASAERIPDHDRSPEPRLDARHALTYMRDVLDELEAPAPLPLG